MSLGHLRDRHRHVVHLALLDKGPGVAADKKDPVAEAGRGPTLVDGHHTVGQKVNELRETGVSRSSSAATSARGVAQAVPTKTWSPERTSATASRAETTRSRQPALGGDSALSVVTVKSIG